MLEITCYAAVMVLLALAAVYFRTDNPFDGPTGEE